MGFIYFLWMLLIVTFVVVVLVGLIAMVFPPREKRTDAYWIMIGDEFRSNWSDAFDRMGLSDEEIDENVAKYIRKHKKYWKDSIAEKNRWWKLS